jgi:RimJ/RimL family protein N-acetyltransferase
MVRLTSRLTSSIHNSGYYLNPSVGSKGLMTAVVAEGLAYAKQYMNAGHIQGMCRSDNIASRRVLEKNGFIQQHQQEANELQMEWKKLGLLKVVVYNMDLNHAET